MSEPSAHHPVFNHFRPFEGWSEPGFEAWHFGVQVRDWLFTGKSKGVSERRMVKIAHPEIGEEYFEWIALLTAISTCEQRFRMFELGAGWGRWSIAAAMASRQRGLPFDLVAIEPEPSHFEWLEMSFRDNELDPAEHYVRQAAVMPENGSVGLAGANTHEYGQYVTLGIRALLPYWRNKHAVRKVEAISFRELLEKYPQVDLIDMDIQGMEAKVLASVSRELLHRVRIIHIGTHSRKIERELTEIFTRLGWLSAFSFPGHSESKTPFGVVRFEDGVQTWVNPSARTAVRQITGIDQHG